MIGFPLYARMLCFVKKMPFPASLKRILLYASWSYRFKMCSDPKTHNAHTSGYHRNRTDPNDSCITVTFFTPLSVLISLLRDITDPRLRAPCSTVPSRGFSMVKRSEIDEVCSRSIWLKIIVNLILDVLSQKGNNVTSVRNCRT